VNQLALAESRPEDPEPGRPPLTIVVYGRPAPQGSKSPKGRTRTGRVILVESSKYVRPWRELVHAAAVVARAGRPPLEGPLVARMVFTVAKPKSAPKRRRTYPATIPDLSKLARAVEDALTDAGLWRDDGQVVGYSRLWKSYPNEDPEALEAPGVRITVEEVPRCD
jgi:Holliday junction resolvase RusA-like endonuclease